MAEAPLCAQEGANRASSISVGLMKDKGFFAQGRHDASLTTARREDSGGLGMKHKNCKPGTSWKEGSPLKN